VLGPRITSIFAAVKGRISDDAVYLYEFSKVLTILGAITNPFGASGLG
jgi:hypothetical protein